MSTTRLTLDQLMTSTGVSALAGRDQEKTAEPASFAKLAERCRQAAQVSNEGSEERRLIEKTAQIAIISRTLAEIEAIAGESLEKSASDVDVAGFINASLAAGHRPDQIAAFLKEAGWVGRAISNLRGRWAARGVEKATATAGKKVKARNFHIGEELRDSVRNHSPAKRDKLLRELRSRHGDAVVSNIIQKGGDDLAGLNTGPIQAARGSASDLTLGTIGSKAKAIAKHPAAMIGGGAVAGGAIASQHDNKNSGGKGGVVVFGR